MLIPSGPGEDGKHLYAILTNPCQNASCLLVTVTSIKEGRFFDPACRIEPGEHEFITKPSYVEYRMSRILRCEQITKCVDGWYFTPKPAVSDDLINRMRQGVVDSNFTAKLVLKYLEDNKDR
ncbi:hypothetical protein [Mesorhizobium helmanticense]|uniref:hypothetical protein n=1 Tax=Mesorhizobium helmanticense TaxID=1776423 RepID=UPI0011B20469|nr:hypothetical protein [Mesorhizobium helmanticense]